jgi:hypothetical protein
MTTTESSDEAVVEVRCGVGSSGATDEDAEYGDEQHERGDKEDQNAQVNRARRSGTCGRCRRIAKRAALRERARGSHGGTENTEKAEEKALSPSMETDPHHFLFFRPHARNLH